jgi:hypothetical protein
MFETSDRQLTFSKLFLSMVFSAAVFGALGTVAAIWENPIFVRMTPAGGWEVSLLFLLAVLSGIYVAIRRPFCMNKKMGAGGLFGFLGITCPICNKILLLAFGSELLMTYFEPLRIYMAAVGVAIAGWAVIDEWRSWRDVPIA